ncbi:MAG: sensor histidine kinase N-terminal domain-containing protein [Burkholderiales bacterium]|nr:sensor histidine kinase N-terminal domain-containing protein [Burkholderiales bacterium]
MSLAARLLEWLLAPLLSIWLVSLGISFMSARNNVDTVLDDGLNAVAAILVSEWEQRLTTRPDSPIPSDATRRWMNVAPEYPMSFLIVDERGAPLAGDDALVPFLRETVAADDELDSSAKPPGQAFERIRGFNSVLDDVVLRVVRRPFAVAGKEFTLAVAQSRERQGALLSAGMAHEAVAQSVVLLVAFSLLWYGLTYVAQPMKVLQEHLDARSADDSEPIPEELAPHEIAPLIASTNALIQRLQTSLAAQKRFIANAAHQLRTPLAALQAQAELIQRLPEGSERREAVARLVSTGQRASRLANQLLALARAESVGTTGALQMVNLNALCEGVARDVLPQAIDRDVEFAFDASEDTAEIVGDATLLGEMVRNLVDNAFKYTPRHGSVVLTVSATPKRIVVDDSGPGIAEADRERVFAPFARVAQVDAETGAAIAGTGLGLAIVREVAQTHGARVHVATSRLGGASFVVSFA